MNEKKKMNEKNLLKKWINIYIIYIEQILIKKEKKQKDFLHKEVLCCPFLDISLLLFK